MIGLLCLFFQLNVFAETQGASPGTNSPYASEGKALPLSGTEENETQETPRKKVKAHHEKEAEGTEALHRFESDITKSKYRYKGQPIEVDTD